MTHTEALRLALEAMKIKQEVTMWANDGDRAKFNRAITAIKAALEAKDEPWEKFCDSHCVWTDHHPDCKLAKDEPVACRACNGSGHMVRDPDIGTDQECFVCEGSGVFEDTTPPQRKPLTDEEIEDAWASCEPDWDDKVNVLTLARAIEAAHGIKGEA